MFHLIVTSHTNPSLSGVAKFNRHLADRMGVPCLGFGDAPGSLADNCRVLVSVKMSDITDTEIDLVRDFLAAADGRKAVLDLFFHTFDGNSLEYDLLEAGQRIFCANPEIRHALMGFDKQLIDAWCPYLVDLGRKVEETHFNVFSFGMAHKMQIGYYRKLHQKLTEYHLDYSLWVSTAFHEKANFGDFHSVSNQLSQVFGNRIQFLGFLSDDAINYFMEKIQMFVAFFPKGVRANNTSVYVPMEKGLPVLTNLDEYSPAWMRHGENVLDIHQSRKQDMELDRLRAVGDRARIDARKHASWDSLVEIFR